jgi:hypothetical protein
VRRSASIAPDGALTDQRKRILEPSNEIEFGVPGRGVRNFPVATWSIGDQSNVIQNVTRKNPNGSINHQGLP